MTDRNKTIDPYIRRIIANSSIEERVLFSVQQMQEFAGDPSVYPCGLQHMDVNDGLSEERIEEALKSLHEKDLVHCCDRGWRTKGYVRRRWSDVHQKYV